MRKLVVFVALGITALFLIGMTMEYRPHSFFNNSPPASQHYLQHALEETGTYNAVAAVLFDYRAFDTVGEVLVIVATATTVSLAFGARVFSRTGTGLSPIVKASVALYAPLILLMALYTILFSPGGGFKGGVLLGSLAWIKIVAYGSMHEFEFMRRRHWQAVMAAASLIILVVSATPVLWGQPFLTNLYRLSGQPRINSAVILSVFTGFAVAMAIGIIFSTMIRIDEEVEP